MDSRVERAVLSKVTEAVQSAAEVREIQERIGSPNPQELALGIAIGRIYNSFHYQTRRILGRSATKEEFAEFLDLLSRHVGEIRRATE